MTMHWTSREAQAEIDASGYTSTMEARLLRLIFAQHAEGGAPMTALEMSDRIGQPINHLTRPLFLLEEKGYLERPAGFWKLNRTGKKARFYQITPLGRAKLEMMATRGSYATVA